MTLVGGTHSDHLQIAFDPVDANVCYMATDGGMYKSTNAGATWTLVSNALIATQLYSIGVSQAGAFKLGGGTQDQGIVATEGPNAWRDTGAGNEGGFFVVDPNSSANIYTTPWSNNLRRSRDGGFTWTDIRNGMTEVVAGVPSAPATVTHLAVKPGDSNLLIAVGVITATGYWSARVFRSTDQGDNWASVAPLDATGLRVAFAPSSAARVFVATAAGRVLRSTDGGATWTDCTGVLPSDQLPNMPVNSLVVDQNNPDVVYVATDVGLFRTQDAGASWHAYNDGFLNFDVPRIIVTELALRRS
ncbi:MAG: hypothetical protein ABIX11_08730, partial [Casimicrobiaceae bacterium]